MPIPPSIYFVLRYHDRYGFVNHVNGQHILFENKKIKGHFPVFMGKVGRSKKKQGSVPGFSCLSSRSSPGIFVK